MMSPSLTQPVRSRASVAPAGTSCEFQDDFGLDAILTLARQAGVTHRVTHRVLDKAVRTETKHFMFRNANKHK